MTSDYTLENRILGSRFKLDINKYEFDQLSDAHALFSAIFRIEESLDILMENYFSLESASQAVVLRDMINRHHSYAHFNSIRSELTRHTINILATFTAYIAVIKKTKLLDPSLVDATNSILSVFHENYDCRLLEVVRNISQHRELPVSGLTLGSSWRTADGKVGMLARMKPIELNTL